ncbi:MAG: hybrid sensor histidine kinase/response regulator, partial [Pseudomonadota bacterium]
MTGPVLGALVALLLGYGGIAATAQRARRMAVLTRAQSDLQNMAHALPLVVFRYQQPAQGLGQFTFVGQGLNTLLGIDPQHLTDDPGQPWRLARLATMKPPTEAVEFPVMLGATRRWIRCDSTPTRHADDSITYNGYWLDITERKAI